MTHINVITGFLGAGKTTFIKSLLAEGVLKDEKVVILENEFGDVNMDAETLSGLDIPVVELTKGCICCSLKGDFIATLVEIYRLYLPDRLIIEPSGIFMLETLYDLLAHDDVKDLYQLNSVTSIVDVTLFDGRFMPMEGFIRNQIRHSGYVVFSKLKNETNLRYAKNFVESINEQIECYDWIYNETISMITSNILQLKKVTKSNTILKEQSQSYHERFQSMTLIQKRSLSFHDFNNFVKAIKEGQFGDIMRLKGMIKIEEDVYECHFTSGIFNYKKIHFSKDLSIVVIGTELKYQKLKHLFHPKKCQVKSGGALNGTISI